MKKKSTKGKKCPQCVPAHMARKTFDNEKLEYFSNVYNRLTPQLFTLHIKRLGCNFFRYTQHPPTQPNRCKAV